MEIPVDLYRTVKPNELLTMFKFNSSSETVTLDQLFGNVPPKLLGSFKLNKEVDLLDGESVMNKIPCSFRPEICRVRRLANGGISCFNEEAHRGNVHPLPPDLSLETGRWYYLEAADVEGNETLCEYLKEEPDDPDFEYDGHNSIVFLCFKLPAGVHLPPGFETHFDVDSPGHWTIRRSDFYPFDACFCHIVAGFKYGMIPDLVNMGWTFAGLKLKAAPRPTAYNDSFDKDTWTLATIIYAYFSCLSSEELVNDAENVLSELSTVGYIRESFRSPKITEMLTRVLNDLAIHCNEQELNIICRLKRG